MSSDEAAILDILKAARLAQSFVSGMDKDQFVKDVKTQSSVLHQLLVLGEAVKRLTEDFRNQHSHIPWKEIAGMRDMLIHQYDAVDLDEVWKTLTADLPSLISLLDKLAPTPPRE